MSPDDDDQSMSKDEQLLVASFALDFEAVKGLLADDACAGYQDPVTGHGPLHKIVLAANAAKDAKPANDPQEILEYLLANGAVWMQVDRNNETPGCLARRLGQTQLYEAIKMHGVYAEVLLNYVERTDSEGDENVSSTHDDFLNSKLEYDEVPGVLLDDQGAPVMMNWESTIMKETAQILLPTVGKGRVLNVGFGMGIVDGFLQERKPESHVIVEAHPAVIQRMKDLGWDKKPNVEIVHSKWQDAVEQLSEGEPFDAIYYDAYAESYRDLREFFEAVVGLLKPNGIFSFFNGLGADRFIVNDVYSVVVALDLAGFGMDVNYTTIPINLTEETWEGTKTGRYWELDRYLLPICNFVE